jgi:hypothetical protein
VNSGCHCACCRRRSRAPETLALPSILRLSDSLSTPVCSAAGGRNLPLVSNLMVQGRGASSRAAECRADMKVRTALRDTSASRFNAAPSCPVGWSSDTECPAPHIYMALKSKFSYREADSRDACVRAPHLHRTRVIRFVAAIFFRSRCIDNPRIWGHGRAPNNRALCMTFNQDAWLLILLASAVGIAVLFWLNGRISRR